MKLIIAGSKTFNDYPKFKTVVDEFMVKHRHDELELILIDDNPGAATLGGVFAKENEIPYQVFTLDEQLFGDEAPAVRDVQMVDSATALLVFYDGVSTGKSRKQDVARKRGILIEIFDYSKP